MLQGLYLTENTAKSSETCYNAKSSFILLKLSSDMHETCNSCPCGEAGTVSSEMRNSSWLIYGKIA